MQTFKLIQNYLAYWFRSQTKYRVHSPFLFQLFTNVFENKLANRKCGKIESLKKQLLENHHKITVMDLGAKTACGLNHIRKISYLARTSSKPAKYGRLLFHLVENFKPLTILELGTSLGLSSAYMAVGNPSSKVITVEGCPNISELARKNFIELGLLNISLINGNFDEVLPDILYSVDKVDFVFIDGNHREEPTIKYFEQCLTKAVNETVFVFDDIHWSEGMEKAWKYIQNHPRVTLTADIFFMGIVFLKKELTRQHFIIRF
jgi:predicted O-methyltransferase YrrM